MAPVFKHTYPCAMCACLPRRCTPFASDSRLLAIPGTACSLPFSAPNRKMKSLPRLRSVFLRELFPSSQPGLFAVSPQLPLHGFHARYFERLQPSRRLLSHLPAHLYPRGFLPPGPRFHLPVYAAAMFFSAAVGRAHIPSPPLSPAHKWFLLFA